MNKIKIGVATIFIAVCVFALAASALGYPPFLAKARKYGAKDCTFCHIDPAGGPPWNERGNWLIKEKERRGADAVDVDWLAEYKPGGEDKKSSDATTPATSASPVEQELLKLEREWLDAYTNRNAAAMERIEADDFTITYPDGRVLTKADEVASMKTPAPAGPRPALSTEDTRVRVYGDTAVVTGVLIQKMTNNGHETTIRERYTDVYVKRNGRWQAVASQLTRIGS
ncbi:MAG TPA: nuclear transport factor 2 family protein [Blastocatellia bacterium]|nr:nuclear transport factor 2 family protein [Blastocatellia bacterium]